MADRGRSMPGAAVLRFRSALACCLALAVAVLGSTTALGQGGDGKTLVISTESLSGYEGRSTRTYTARLGTQPTGTVTVGVASQDRSVATVTPPSLIFTPSNWNAPQILTVVLVDNDVDHPVDQCTTIGYTFSGADYDGVSRTALPQVCVIDNDQRRLRVLDSSVVVGEGRTTQQAVWLMTEPTGDVTVRVESQDTSLVTVSPTELTITPRNWRTRQEVTFIGADDDVFNSSPRRTTVEYTVSGADYDGVTYPPTRVTLVDNEPYRWEVPEGTSFSYSLSMVMREGSPPIVMSPASSDPDVLSVAPETITWTLETSGQWHKVTATVHDNEALGNGLATISHPTNPTPDWLLPIQDIIVTVLDDDVAGVTVAPTDLSAAVGETVTYSVVLDVKPFADVTLSAASEDAGVATVDPVSLTFTPSDWNRPQILTLTAGGRGLARISHDASGGGYDDAGVDDVTVLVSPAGPALTVRADPNPITAGECSTLSWTPREDAESVVVLVGDEELATVPAATATSHEVCPPETTAYRLEAQDGKGAPLGDFPVTVTVLPRPPTNRPPTVSASCDPCEVAPGGKVSLAATASDPDGDPLTYAWSAPLGNFGGAADGATARWTAPAQSGPVSIRVQVSDGRGGSASADVAVEVVNRPPTVSASCDPCEVAPGGEVSLAATASDPDGDPLTYAWSAPEGRFDGAADGATARWTAPAQAGPVTIRVRVSDGRGGSASADLAVEVSNAIARARLRRVNEAILPELSRAIVSGTVEEVARRIKEADPQAPATRSGYTVAGHSAISEALMANGGTIDWKRALAGSSFTFGLGGGNAPPARRPAG